MAKPSRNDACPCGSGREYKQCCARGQTTSATRVQEVHLSAGHALAIFRQASACHARGRLHEAARLYRQGLALNPKAWEMLANLGSILDDLGRHEEAIECYTEVLASRPRLAEVRNNLGLALQALGCHDEAEASFREAIATREDFLPAYFNLGRLLHLRGRHEEAAQCYRRVLSLQPGNAQARNNLAMALEAQSDHARAIAAYRQAVGDDPKLIAAHRGLAEALRRIVPVWHVPMMNDKVRNDAYFAALQGAIGPETHVLEIGTGSGLLAMMAARLGAAHVTTCEAEPIIAETAHQIIAENGYAARIKLLAKRSTEVKDTDMPRPADVLVSEIFGSELLGERVLSSIEDAKRRLLQPQCRIIPAAASIMIALFGGEALGDNLVVEDVYGFDLHAFNGIVPRRQTVSRDDLDVQMLSDDVEAFRFDFEGQSSWPAETKTLHIPIRSSGRCYGIIQWIRLQMDANTTFENHPRTRAPASSWVRCAYLLPMPVNVTAGQVAIVTAMHNRICPWFSVERFESLAAGVVV